MDLMWRLADATTNARYWQEPDETDLLLEADDFRAALAPVARALTGSPAAAWWPTGVDRGTQHVVRWVTGRPAGPPASTLATVRVVREAIEDDERRAYDRPQDPAAPFIGHWWSAPIHHPEELISSTRAIDGVDIVGLMLVEDGPDWEEADVRALTVDDGCRVYEVDGPEAWTALVAAYPLEVTRSRRHDWWRATGRAGPWHLPDWERVAADYDGVHLTVRGYLTTAGRALELDGTATVLAGWDPDRTFWLTDAVRVAGPGRRVRTPERPT